MSQRIARLLDEPETRVAKLVSKMEDNNGYPSHDARFLAETIQKIRSKLADLNLDPDDTTAEELHHALQVKFERDSQLFDEYFGALNLDFGQKVAKAERLLEAYSKEARQWGLKNKFAKDILRSLPPKRLMKHLNYRSAESMLKREDLAEIYLAASRLESNNWLKAHKRLVSKLDQTAFEIRNVKLMNLDAKKWESIAAPAGFMVQNEEIAALGVWPSEAAQKASLLNLVLMLADTLGQYADVRASRAAAHLNGIVAWWADMDHLVAELYNEPVSLNLKDCSANCLNGDAFESRSLEHGRKAFWQELVSRYENLPDIDGLFDESVRRKIAGLKLAAPEPAYEFVEDF